MTAEICFDLVMDEDMSCVEGSYRLPGRGWEILIFVRERRIDAPRVRTGATWERSGVTGTYVVLPRTVQLNKEIVKQMLSEALGVAQWQEVRGPDSLALRCAPGDAAIADMAPIPENPDPTPRVRLPPPALPGNVREPRTVTSDSGKVMVETLTILDVVQIAAGYRDRRGEDLSGEIGIIQSALDFHELDEFYDPGDFYYTVYLCSYRLFVHIPTRYLQPVGRTAAPNEVLFLPGVYLRRQHPDSKFHHMEVVKVTGDWIDATTGCNLAGEIGFFLGQKYRANEREPAECWVHFNSVRNVLAVDEMALEFTGRIAEYREIVPGIKPFKTRRRVRSGG